MSRHSRTRPLLIGLIIIGSIFIVRLFWLQIIQHSYYVDQANAEHISKFTLPAQRGQIYARDGNGISPLVLNEASFLVYADPQEVTDKQAVIDGVKSVAGGNTVDGFESRLDSKKLRYVVVAKSLSKDQAELLKKKKIPGVGFQKGEQRVYPEGVLASQLLGYVNGDGVGQYGLEGALNKELTGVPGELKAVTDIRQIPLTISNDYVNKPAVNGQNLVLNVDRNIQAYAESALKKGLDSAKATKGSVIVIDPQNGHVMAMANYPTYDPAQYNKVSDYGLFQNKTVSEPYEAGSIVKTLTMGAGLDSGAVRVNSTYDNTGSFVVDGVTIKNVEEDPVNAHATMTDVLHYSLNTGADYVLSQMGGGNINDQARAKLYDYFTNHYLLGSSTGIEQASEQPGVIHPSNTGYGLNILYANMAFGQGMQVTSLQMAAAFSAAINGGTYYQPQLVNGIKQDDDTIKLNAPKILKSGVLQPSVSGQLHDMIVTARQIGALGGKDRAGYTVGGKTGTAQIIDPKTGKYTNDNSIGTYLGFGGGKTPRYVILVKVDDSHIYGYAGTTAAGPIFTDLSNWLLSYLQIDPNK